ncbi:MAG: UDP-N-acetylmuramate dehydrogenase [Wenzhouxiangella sp.]|nr:MAG: UDP-N-acetylmuramate dehydrogenase [Wenzhouxiangella sp.]
MRPPEIVEGADLAPLSTFRLPARAGQLVVLDDIEQLPLLPPDDGPRLVLGGGSNTLFLADWPGQVLLNRLGGIQTQALEDGRVRVRAAAGESWHGLVRWCLDRGLYGIENLVLIPGSVGAAPMQNIGAYGVELADVLESVTVWDWSRRAGAEIPAAECGLAYRDSRFKSADRGRFLITAVSLRLRRDFRPALGYQSLADALAKRRLTPPQPRQLAAAIMRLRRRRLPDPARLANAGSFFKNPVVSPARAEQVLADHPDLPCWRLPDGRFKLAAGWMIEQLGWRGRRIGDAGVHEHHALVLVNHGRASAAQLLELMDSIREAVDSAFGVRLEPEPQLVGWNPDQKRG